MLNHLPGSVKMNNRTLFALSALVLATTGCSGSNNDTLQGSAPESAQANAAVDSAASATSFDFEPTRYPALDESELAPQTFFSGTDFLFDGFDFTSQGLELLEVLKGRSKFAFENLNTAFVEGTVPQDTLDCSLYQDGTIIYGYACDDERDTNLLDAYGFPMFLASTTDSNRCAALPLGAFNDIDCSLSAFNFASATGLYGYYRSYVEDDAVLRESLTITQQNVPSFIDPTSLPGSCIFEIHSDGTVLLSEFDECGNAINSLLEEFN